MTLTINLALDSQNKENDLEKFNSILKTNFNKNSLFVQNNHFELGKISSFNSIFNINNSQFLSTPLINMVPNPVRNIDSNLLNQTQTIKNSPELSTPLISTIPDFLGNLSISHMESESKLSISKGEFIKWNL